MTNEQIAAFTAFGLLLAENHPELLEEHTFKEIQQLSKDIDKYLSPQISDEQNMVAPIIAVLREAIQQAKEAE